MAPASLGEKPEWAPCCPGTGTTGPWPWPTLRPAQVLLSCLLNKAMPRRPVSAAGQAHCPLSLLCLSFASPVTGFWTSHLSPVPALPRQEMEVLEDRPLACSLRPLLPSGDQLGPAHLCPAHSAPRSLPTSCCSSTGPVSPTPELANKLPVSLSPPAPCPPWPPGPAERGREKAEPGASGGRGREARCPPRPDTQHPDRQAEAATWGPGAGPVPLLTGPQREEGRGASQGAGGPGEQREGDGREGLAEHRSRRR